MKVTTSSERVVPACSFSPIDLLAARAESVSVATGRCRSSFLESYRTLPRCPLAKVDSSRKTVRFGLFLAELVEPGQDSEDPPVVVAGVGQLQLAEDPLDVGADGVQRDEQ